MIGAGTFARVFRAVHKETGGVVAVKVLRRRHRDQVAQVEQFLREGRMGLQLRHPNIVTIHEIEMIRAHLIWSWSLSKGKRCARSSKSEPSSARSSS